MLNKIILSLNNVMYIVASTNYHNHNIIVQVTNFIQLTQKHQC